MTRYLSSLIVALLLTSAALLADTSQTFAPLRTSPVFLSRVSFTIAFTTPVILTEAATGSYTAACHTKRAALAVQVAANPDGYANIFAAHLVTNVNVTGGGALTGTLAAGTLDTPATDAALFSAVSSLWSTVAGCITNP